PAAQPGPRPYDAGQVHAGHHQGPGPPGLPGRRHLRGGDPAVPGGGLRALALDVRRLPAGGRPRVSEPGPRVLSRAALYISSLIDSRSSSRWTGRPLPLRKVFPGSMPRVRYTVASTRCGDRGTSRGRSPRAVVAPTARPILRPPPAIRADMAAGQGSRPAARLIFGVRPHSPHMTVTTCWPRPRAGRT